MTAPVGDDVPVARRWNHNIAVHRRLLAEVPLGEGRALEVGCGDGTLAVDLADRGLDVLAVDADAGCVERTRALLGDRPGVEVRQADVMEDDLSPASFDLVTAVAVLHHLDLRSGLVRLADLVGPGGTLAVVGLARTRTGWDLAHDAAGAVATRVGRRRHGGLWEHAAPIADPKETYSEVLRVATLLLPGVRYRRHLLFRYSLLWTRPTDWEPPT